MREIIRNHAKLGVDQIKLSMSGEEVKPKCQSLVTSIVLTGYLRCFRRPDWPLNVSLLTRKRRLVWMKVGSVYG